MIWEGIWKHHHAPDGLVTVLHHYLKEARPDNLRFRHRVSSITSETAQSKDTTRDQDQDQDQDQGQPTRRWRVDAFQSLQNPSLSDHHQPNEAASTLASEGKQVLPVTDTFDTVIICIPGPDVLDIRGVKNGLGSDEKFSILENVGYDSRAAVAVVYDPKLKVG